MYLDNFFTKSADRVQVFEEISSWNVVQEKVNSLFVLEHVVHAEQEGVFDILQNILLVFIVLNLLFLNEDV
jgi:hypothetical protein